MIVTEKHSHILRHAEEIFAEKGFDGATVRDIADAAGVNVAMISYYFGSKEKLMEILFRERMNVVRSRLEDLINSKSLNPFQKIEVLVEEYISRVIQKQCFYRIMITEQVVNKNSVVVTYLKEIKLHYATLFSRLVAEGQKLKVFKKNIDVVMVLTVMTGTVTQLIINKDYYREFNQLKKMSDTRFDELLKEKLVQHVTDIFKTLLGYEK
jgi:AcrR family transcriptional regulator